MKDQKYYLNIDIDEKERYLSAKHKKIKVH